MPPRKSFEIPKIEEVVNFMTSKFKDWPDSFCVYYGNKFWNHYQSNGWRISGKAAMKDWNAAISGQWSTLKWKEDLDMLYKCQQESVVSAKNLAMLKERNNQQAIPADNAAYLDDVMDEYIKHPTLIPIERLAACYDWLKQNRLISLSKDQVQAARDVGTENICKGKALAVKFVFEYMANNVLTFKKISHVSA